MKVGILTWHYLDNYGSVLQAYALMKLLESKGLDTEFINYRKNAKTSIIFDFLRFIKYNFIKFNDEEKRKSTFYKFRKKYFKETKMFNSKESLNYNNFNYDFLVCGSDQIWSSRAFDDVYFFNFNTNKGRKFSYAASTIEDDYTKEQKKIISTCLKDFNKISVREKKGIEILKNFTKKEIVEVLDPTLMIEKDEYLNLTLNSKFNDDDYVLCYFIGDIDRYKDITYKVKDKFNAKKIININIKDVHNFGDIIIRNASPCDFLNLIKNAKVVLSDSYHAVLFSLIFNKEFLAVKRYLDTDNDNQNERISNILNIIDEKIRYINYDDDIAEFKSLDYSKISNLINMRKKIADEYLNSVLKD